MTAVTQLTSPPADYFYMRCRFYTGVLLCEVCKNAKVKVWLQEMADVNEPINPSALSTYQIGLIQARAYRSLSQHFSFILKPFDLTIAEWTTLGVLSEKDATTMGELASSLDTKPSHPTVIIDKLEAKGLVTRTSADYDSRIKAVRLTKEGRAFIKDAEPKVRQALSLYLRTIPREKLVAYFEVLQSL